MLIRSILLGRLCASTAASLALLAPTVSYAQQRSFQLDIPAQDLGGALKALANGTGQQIIFKGSAAHSKRSNALKGNYSADDALAIMLRGSGLSSSRTPRGVIVVTAAAVEEPSVTPSAIDAVPTPTPARPADRAPVARQDSALGEIVVTAQKREENLQNVPIAVTAVRPQALATSGIDSITDLGTAVPGLNLLSVGGGISPRLRGVGAAAVTAGAESPVAAYVDGVYYAFSVDLNVDIQDVSQITVLKGPQGTLFGRNATGGVIQFNTRDPKQKFELDLTTSYDSWQTSRSHGYIGGGIAENTAAGFSVSYTTQGKGWGTNLSDGREVHKINHDLTMRGKLLYDDGTTRAVLSADYTNQKDDLPFNYRPAPGYSVLLAVPQSSRKWDTNNYLPNIAKHEAAGATLNASHDLGFARVVSISAYRWGNSYGVFNTTATSIPSIDLTFPQRSEQFSQEVQLVSKDSKPFTWVLGGYYFWNKASTGTVDYNIRPFGLTFNINGEQKTESLAAFAQGTYSFTDSTRLTLGLRYTHEDKNFDGNDNFAGPTFYTGKLAFKKLTWRIAVDQDIAEHVMAYASFNRGFKSGTFNTGAPATPAVKPETLDAYEVGLKSELLDRRLRLNLAAFYYDYTNIQVNAFERTSILLNGKGAKIWGLDADLEAAVTDRLRLTANVNWLPTAEFRSFPNAQFSTPLPNNQGAITFTGDATGNRLPNTAKVTFAIGADYKVDTDFGPLTFNVNDAYSSKFYGESDNRLFQKSYHLLNASVAWKAPDGRFGARLWATNLINEAVASGLTTFDASTLSGYIASYSNPPRTYGITLQASF